ncbi:PAS domain S-box protein, partial [Deinococcus pimensis]|uniref:PAS domain S-box protein n=1 Tax=Deinococcus pimensis TaxID=309888 RepID=UPI0012F74532
ARSVHAWRRAVEGRAPYDVRHRVLVADGTYRVLHSRAVPVLGSSGEVREWVGVSTDVTEQVRAEEVLRGSEERFRRLVEASPVGIAVGAIDGSLRYPNDAYLELLGFTRADFEAGRLNWAELTPPQYREVDERAFHQALRRGTSEPYEKEMRRRDGSLVPVGLVLTRDEQHGGPLVVAYVQDLTAQKAAEDALWAYSAELERRVEERTRALEEQRAALDAFVSYSRAVGTDTDTTVLARRALSVLESRFPGASAAYYEPDGPVWRAIAMTDDMREDVRAMIEAGVPADLPLFARVTRERREVFEDAWDGDAQGVDVTDEYAAGAAYPVVVEDSVVGIVALGLRGTPVWSERDREVVRAVGRGLTLALERGARAAR